MCCWVWGNDGSIPSPDSRVGFRKAHDRTVHTLFWIQQFTHYYLTNQCSVDHERFLSTYDHCATVYRCFVCVRKHMASSFEWAMSCRIEYSELFSEHRSEWTDWIWILGQHLFKAHNVDFPDTSSGINVYSIISSSKSHDRNWNGSIGRTRHPK